MKEKNKKLPNITKNTDIIKFETKNKYKNMSKKENIKEKAITCLI